MKLKDLEKEINNQIKEENMEESKFRFDETIDVIRSRVREYLKKEGYDLEDYDKGIYVECGYGCGKNVYIKSRLRYNGRSIEIKIRRKKNGFEYGGLWGRTYYYGIKSIEVSDYYDSIEELIENEKKDIKEKNEYKREKIKEFDDGLEKLGISFKDFMDLKDKWGNVDYNDRINLAKGYVGEDYWRYI